MQNSVQREITSSSSLTAANTFSHIPHIDTRKLCLSEMNSAFTSVPPPFGTAQAFLLRLAQLEAQLVLNLIRNVAIRNHNGYGNPLVPLSLLPLAGIQRSSILSMYHPHLLQRKHMNSLAYMAGRPSSSVAEINSTIVSKDSADLLAKEVNQKKTSLPTNEDPLVRSSTKHTRNYFTFKPDVDHTPTGQTAPKPKVMIEEAKPTEQRMLYVPKENLLKALSNLGLSLEDLELLSHCPDDQLTTEKLPLIIQDIQQCKRTNATEKSQVGGSSSDQMESSRQSPYAYEKHHNQRSQRMRQSASQLPYEKEPNFFSKRRQRGFAEVTRWKPGSVCYSSRSKYSFSSPDSNNTRHYTTKRSLPSPYRSTTLKTMRKCHHQTSTPAETAKSDVTAQSANIQMTGPKMPAKTSAQTKGVIRVSGIYLDYSENDLIKMASPFGHPVEVFMATEVNTATSLQCLKALLMLPTEFSAREMVKVYSAIPVHLRHQSLEMVHQTIDFSSPVSMFYAFMGQSVSNGLLTPVEHLLVVCNVPNHPCAASGVIRLLKPFGQVLRTLVLNRSKVDADQCLWNKNSIQMVLEMESASVALSVYEWSLKVPCLYDNHRLSFLRGCHVQKNTSSEINST